MDFSNDDMDSEPLTHGLSAIDLSSGDSAGLLTTTANAQNGNFASMDGDVYELIETADEERFTNALRYLNRIKTQFDHQPDFYNLFRT